MAVYLRTRARSGNALPSPLSAGSNSSSGSSTSAPPKAGSLARAAGATVHWKDRGGRRLFVDAAFEETVRHGAAGQAPPKKKARFFIGNR